MSENLYHRFINAFKDENETMNDEKRQPLISDEQLEKTLKTIRKSFQHEKKKIPEEQKIERSSRFQRWILHYLKAPFQKWTPPKEVTNPSDSHVNQHEEENDDEDLPVSSASLMTQIEDSDDEDEDAEIDEDTEESSIIPQPIQKVFNKLKAKVCYSFDFLSIEMIYFFSIRFLLLLLLLMMMMVVTTTKKKKKIKQNLHRCE